MATDELGKLREIMERYNSIDDERNREITRLVDQRVPREQIMAVTVLSREQIRRIANAERKRRSEKPA